MTRRELHRRKEPFELAPTTFLPGPIAQAYFAGGAAAQARGASQTEAVRVALAAAARAVRENHPVRGVRP